MKNSGDFFRGIVICVCIAGIGFSGYKIWGITQEYKKGEEVYSKMQEQFFITDDSVENNQANEDLTEEEQIESKGENESKTQNELKNKSKSPPKIDWEHLNNTYPDSKGWLYMEGTSINYPVVQGKDNQYYVNNTVNGTKNGAGSIFMDFRNTGDFSDQNTVIYGHNMKNGAMFHDLRNFVKDDYVKKHPYIDIMTKDGNIRYEIFSAYVTEAGGESYQLSFENTESYQLYLKNCEKLSAIKSAVTVTTDDSIITLSTCTNSAKEKRFVVHAKRINQ